jgi:predicted RNA-binding protein with PIN domain
LPANNVQTLRWLIDGMNVIGSRPTGWWRDRQGSMRELVAQLERFAADTGEEVTVVFDGRPFQLETDGVQVLFARRQGRDAADDDIAALAERDADPATLRVVTSDAELSRRVQAAGVEAVGAGSFRRRLDG